MAAGAEQALAYPPGVTAPEARYRYAYAVLEALRLKHNERAGDRSPEARHHRALCLEQVHRVVRDILETRPQVRTPAWEPTEEERVDPLRGRLKGEGRAEGAAHADRSALLWDALRVDLDAAGMLAAPPDPLEDFTGYVEVDPNNSITVYPHKLQMFKLWKCGDSYVYADRGAGHFGPAFAHTLKVTSQGNQGAPAQGCCWAVSNVVDDCRGWDLNNNQAIGVQIKYDHNLDEYLFPLEEYENDSADEYATGTGANTTWYLTNERTGDTAFESRFYSDADRTELLDVLSVPVPAGRSYRYVFGVCSYHIGVWNWISFDVEDLDPHEPVHEDAGAEVHVEAGVTDRHLVGTEEAGAAVAVQSGGTDLHLVGSEGEGAAVLVAVGATDRHLVGIEDEGEAVAAAVGGTDVHLVGAEDVGAVVLVVTGGMDELLIGTEDGGAAVAVVIGASDLYLVGVEGPGAVAAVLAGGTDLLKGIERLGVIVHVPAGGTDGLVYKEDVGTVLMAATGGAALHCMAVSLRVPESGQRELVWPQGGAGAGAEYTVVIDGAIAYHTTGLAVRLPESQTVRQILQVLADVGMEEDELLGWLWTPMDVVRCSWTESPTARIYRLHRKPGGGEYELIAELLGLSYDDGPLRDETYTYQVRAVDEEGDEGISTEQSETVASAPEPPSSIAWQFDPETGTLTISWQASPSLDVASYRVRSSAGADSLDLASEPVQDSAETSYEQVFTDEDGVWIFLVRAVDGAGNEEGNIRQIVAIPFQDGAPAARPAEPRWVEARAIENGKINLEWLYDPRYEENGPGAAYEARIYWDAGTGAVDYGLPLDTVLMDRPTAPARYTWQSGPLTDGQTYRFTIRIATALWPSGIKTQNTDEHAATADSSVPATPVLVVETV